MSLSAAVLSQREAEVKRARERLEQDEREIAISRRVLKKKEQLIQEHITSKIVPGNAFLKVCRDKEKTFRAQGEDTLTITQVADHLEEIIDHYCATHPGVSKHKQPVTPSTPQFEQQAQSAVEKEMREE